MSPESTFGASDPDSEAVNLSTIWRTGTILEYPRSLFAHYSIAVPVTGRLNHSLRKTSARPAAALDPLLASFLSLVT